jgi:hypothetical protein
VEQRSFSDEENLQAVLMEQFSEGQLEAYIAKLEAHRADLDVDASHISLPEDEGTGKGKAAGPPVPFTKIVLQPMVICTSLDIPSFFSTLLSRYVSCQ